MLIVVAFLIDQISKLVIVSYLTPFEPPLNIIGSLLRFKLTYNPYGVFSISFGPNILYYIFSIVGLVVLTYIALTYKDKIGVIIFGFIVGGAIGNIVDRLRLGQVIDFVDVGIGESWRWPVFNVADSCVTIGVLLLAIGYRRQPADASQSDPA